jgi:hypothetical protein
MCKGAIWYTVQHTVVLTGRPFTLLSKRQMVKVKVKQSHYRPVKSLKVPGAWGSNISRLSAHEGRKIVSLTHRPPLSQEIFVVIFSVRGWVNPRAIVRPEGLWQWKIRMTPSGIEPSTFRLVAQCLKQQRHRVPQFQRDIERKFYGNLKKKEVHLENLW